MTQQEALDLIKQLLRAQDDEQLMQLLSLHLPSVDGTFFSTADAAVRQLERDGKAGTANALRGLADRMLRMKTLI